MSADNALALAVAALLMVYLVASLVFPERF
jgi:K+-transporting ATPase KdpF subunit